MGTIFQCSSMKLSIFRFEVKPKVYAKNGMRSNLSVAEIRRSDKEHPKYPHILKEEKIERANNEWGFDITYNPPRRVYVYLVAIVDWHSRNVIS